MSGVPKTDGGPLATVCFGVNLGLETYKVTLWVITMFVLK
jgi:hypothetical protein